MQRLRIAKRQAWSAGIALVCLVGCGGGVTGRSPGIDGGEQDAACEVAPGGGCMWVGCSRSIAAWCSRVSCAVSWPSHPTALCSAYGGDFSLVSVGQCGGYRVVESTGGDAIAYYYYSVSSGQLVAQVDHLLDGDYRCMGGPPGFTRPSCEATTPIDCPDAGSGGSGGNDGGAGSGGAAGGP